MSFDFSNGNSVLRHLSDALPSATAYIHGSYEHPDIMGTVDFYQMPFGVYMVYTFTGLPFNPDKCGTNILAMHIHNGSGCSGNSQDPFANAGSHYNPMGCEHPAHAGDLPPIFVSDGYAFGAVFTHRFNVGDVMGMPLVVHGKSDDFKTQPSGDAGEKIGCGVIRRV